MECYKLISILVEYNYVRDFFPFLRRQATKIITIDFLWLG